METSDGKKGRTVFTTCPRTMGQSAAAQSLQKGEKAVTPSNDQRVQVSRGEAASGPVRHVKGWDCTSIVGDRRTMLQGYLGIGQILTFRPGHASPRNASVGWVAFALWTGFEVGTGTPKMPRRAGAPLAGSGPLYGSGKRHKCRKGLPMRRRCEENDAEFAKSVAEVLCPAPAPAHCPLLARASVLGAPPQEWHPWQATC